MKRLAIRALVLGALIYAGFVGWTAYTMATYSEPDTLSPAAIIVVLSGAWTPDDQPKGETRIRVDRGVELWTQGLAPLLVMSGGGARALPGPGDAKFMADHAETVGVDRRRILVENRSHSTLQNAWFTAQMPGIDKTKPIFVVTHRFHMPRAKASFRWAGFTNITGVSADAEDPVRIGRVHFLETIKWPLNVVRAAGASLALAVGVEEDNVLPWLH